MELIIDGKRDPEMADVADDALGVVAAASQALRQRGRAVVSIKADEEELKPDQLMAALSGRSVRDIKTLEIESAETAALVEACLHDLIEYVPELSNACHILAEIFQGQSPQEGYDHFHRLAEIWRNVKVREMQIVGALDISLENLDLDGVPVARIHEDLNRYLNEALEALKAGDCVSLGDLLEYELAPRAETEVKIVQLLQTQAREKSG